MADRKDRIRVQIEGQEYNLVGGSFQEMLGAVKQVNGRRFVSELKVWQLPGNVEEVQRQLDISGYRLESGAPAPKSGSPGPSAAPSGGGGDKVRITVGGRRLALVGGSFQEMLAVVKTLPGRRFDGDTKLWDIPGEVGVIKGMVAAAGFQLEGADDISMEAVPPMEPPNFSPAGGPPPPFEPPDFANFDNDEDSPEPPDWWDDRLAPPPPPFDEALWDEPPFFEDEPPSRGLESAPVSSQRSGGDRIRLRLGDLPLVIYGGSFQEMLALVKNIQGRRYDGDTRVWVLPETVGLDSLRQRVTAAGFSLEQAD